MITKIYTEPAVEPVSLQDLKDHLRLDSGTFNDNLDPEQSIVSGTHVVTVGYALTGSSVDVLGYQATVILDSGENYELLTLDVAPATEWAIGNVITGQTSLKTCTVVSKVSSLTYYVRSRSGNYTLGEVIGVTGVAAKLADQGAANPTFTAGTVDAKIQESDDNVTYTDWTGGAFTQVTTSIDNAIQQIAYTGTKQYIRVVARVLLAACEFGVSVFKYSSNATEDSLLSLLITAARKEAEAYTWRAFISQTWNGYLDSFPARNYIELPFGQLSSVSSITYTDSAGTLTSMTVTTDYLVDSSSEPGRLVLPYGGSWPSTTFYPVNPIAIRWVCGYGAAAANVPAGIRTAIKMIAADLYASRGERVQGGMVKNDIAKRLLNPYLMRKYE